MGEVAPGVLLHFLSVKSRHVRHSGRNMGIAGFIQSQFRVWHMVKSSFWPVFEILRPKCVENWSQIVTSF